MYQSFPTLPAEESPSSQQSVESQQNESFQPRESNYSSFDPFAYVAEYYTEVGPENRFLLEFYHRVFQHIPRGGALLEFGGGPTVYQLLSARRRAGEIVFAEYLSANRREVEKWIYSDPTAFDWSEYVDFVLRLEHKAVNEHSRDQVRHELSGKISQIIECDAFSADILGRESLRQFDVVSSGFCLECISPHEGDLRDFLIKLDCMLKPGGMLVLTMLKRAHGFKIGDLFFPACSVVDESYMRRLLHYLNYHWLSIESVSAEADQGYEGILAITAEKG